MALVTLVLAAATAAAPAPAAPVDPLERVRCVRESVTGSLALTRKVCHTIREWKRITDDAQAEARRMTQPGTLNEKNGGT